MLGGGGRRRAGPGRRAARTSFAPFSASSDSDVAGVLAQSPPPGRILGTQRIPRGRDPILSTQTFRAAGVFRLGAMSRKLAIFKDGNYVHMVPFFHIIANFVWGRS